MSGKFITLSEWLIRKHVYRPRLPQTFEFGHEFSNLKNHTPFWQGVWSKVRPHTQSENGLRMPFSVEVEVKDPLFNIVQTARRGQLDKTFNQITLSRVNVGDSFESYLESTLPKLKTQFEAQQFPVKAEFFEETQQNKD